MAKQKASNQRMAPKIGHIFSKFGEDGVVDPTKNTRVLATIMLEIVELVYVGDGFGSDPQAAEMMIGYAHQIFDEMGTMTELEAGSTNALYQGYVEGLASTCTEPVSEEQMDVLFPERTPAPLFPEGVEDEFEILKYMTQSDQWDMKPEDFGSEFVNLWQSSMQNTQASVGIELGVGVSSVSASARESSTGAPWMAAGVEMLRNFHRGGRSVPLLMAAVRASGFFEVFQGYLPPLYREPIKMIIVFFTKVFTRYSVMAEEDRSFVTAIRRELGEHWFTYSLSLMKALIAMSSVAYAVPLAVVVKVGQARGLGVEQIESATFPPLTDPIAMIKFIWSRRPYLLQYREMWRRSQGPDPDHKALTWLAANPTSLDILKEIDISSAYTGSGDSGYNNQADHIACVMATKAYSQYVSWAAVQMEGTALQQFDQWYNQPVQKVRWTVQKLSTTWFNPDLVGSMRQKVKLVQEDLATHTFIREWVNAPFLDQVDSWIQILATFGSTMGNESVESIRGQYEGQFKSVNAWFKLLTPAQKAEQLSSISYSKLWLGAKQTDVLANLGLDDLGAYPLLKSTAEKAGALSVYSQEDKYKINNMANLLKQLRPWNEAFRAGKKPFDIEGTPAAQKQKTQNVKKLAGILTSAGLRKQMMPGLIQSIKRFVGSFTGWFKPGAPSAHAGGSVVDEVFAAHMARLRLRAQRE